MTTKLVTVGDVDANGSQEKLTLTVNNGTLTLSGTHGLTFLPDGSSGSTITSNGSASIVVEGTLTDLDNALNGLVYAPNANFVGSDSLSITINDLGNTGLGGAKSTTGTVAIVVNQVNLAPTITVPVAAQIINQGTRSCLRRSAAIRSRLPMPMPTATSSKLP